MAPRRSIYFRVRSAGHFFIVVLALAVSSGARGQQLVEVYSTPPDKAIGARSAALADAIASDSYDIEAMYRNPAALSFLQTPGVLVDHRHDWTNKVFQENIAARLFTSRLVALGIGAGIAGNNLFSSPRQLSFVQYDLDVAASIRPFSSIPGMSIGVLSNLRSGKADIGSASAAQIDIGIIYSPMIGTTYSFVYRGIGGTVGYYSTDGPAGSPSGARFEQTNRSLELASTLKFPSESRTPFLTFSAAAMRDYSSGNVIIRGGAEATVWDILSLRVGYVNADVKQLRAGGGISLSGFALDYAIMPRTSGDRYDEFTLKIAF